MAKRKRLGPARSANNVTQNGTTEPDTPSNDGYAVFPRYPLGVAQHAPPRPAPIASVAGQSASEAALAELSDTLRSAREEGRLIQALPLEAIEADHLVRDRLSADEDEMQALITSIRARGQQTPIEVVALDGDRFGLISGWRRLAALRRLAEEDAKFGTVLAILRRPDSAAEAYCAMVEENEIRVGLSYYERARIVARAAGQGVYPDARAALSGLFAAASRAKRSKIGSFVRLHDALDDALRFPAAIPERLGLALVKAIEADEGLTDRLRAALAEADAEDPQAEMAVLNGVLEGPRPAAKQANSGGTGSDLAGEAEDPIRLSAKPGKLTLSGPGVTADLIRDLQDWLAERS
jgi:ParB/RepB/Spo0J family partition protein